MFRSLVAVRFWETSLAGPGILLTVRPWLENIISGRATNKLQARGYPDLMTRSFLAQIQSDCPHLPMFVLTDFDPDGLSIFKCYRYGTTNFFHESSNSQINFSWLGIQSDHLGSLHKTKMDGIRNDRQNHEWSDNCLVNLTPRDRFSAIRMLQKDLQTEHEDSTYGFVRRELQIMLVLGAKAEIQALDRSGDIMPWLDIVLQKVLHITL